MIKFLFKTYFCSIIFSSLLSISVSGQKIYFDRDFAPADKYTKPSEFPFRDDICLNGSWYFLPVSDNEDLDLDPIKNPTIPVNAKWEDVKIKIPSPWNVNNFTGNQGGDFVSYPEYPEKWESVKAGWLKKTIPYSKEWKNKRIILRFEAIAGYSLIYMNGKRMAENFDLFLPFEVDITDELREKNENELLVWIADAKLFNQKSEDLRIAERIHVGGSFWGEHIIGIWQDVHLLVKPAIHIEDIFIQSFLDQDELVVEATISNTTSKMQRMDLSGEIHPWINLTEKNMLSFPEIKYKLGNPVMSLNKNAIELLPYSSQTIKIKTRVEGRLKEWSTETPNLYGITLSLHDKKKVIDRSYERFGWRQFKIAGREFLLNGTPVTLKGDSWHFMGIPQMTRRYAWAWYEMLKNMNGNAVRLHAQPYPEFYLDMADEMGILVLDETGMWASDGGPNVSRDEYWVNAEDHLRRMILRDRNHPSVFGWSVCNENLPVVIGVQHAPENIIQRQVDEINKWVKITKELDPTRDWISGDGETNRKTILPVVLGHYGYENEMKKWSSEYPVWGIGEQGMAYSGTPKQLSGYGGNRVYESQEGRMEALAAEAVDLLNVQKKYQANFSSIFNVAWYGLKPLEIGLENTSRPPTVDDGIFFAGYQENKPGVQSTRLGPYTTTFNPGYDKSLPLFSPWPLYDAVKLSFSTPEIVKSSWGVQNENTDNNIPTIPESQVVILTSNNNSVIYAICNELGVAYKKKTSVKGRDLLIIDGISPPETSEITKSVDQALKNGGNVFIWGLNEHSLLKNKELFPYSIELSERPASSFLVKEQRPPLNKLGHADFYFTEATDENIGQFVLTGEFVNRSRVLLETCPTDWRKWNHQPEYFKTGAVLRSEREYKPEGNVLVEYETGKGSVYIFTLDPAMLYNCSRTLVKRLLLNLGVTFEKPELKEIAAIDGDGKLEEALVLGPFSFSGKTIQDAAGIDYIGEMDPDNYFPGSETKNLFWEVKKADKGIFDLMRMGFHGPGQQAVAYVSFWIHSPRSLTDLLIEPDMPRLDMLIGVDDASQVYLNNTLIHEYIREGSLNIRDKRIERLPLEKGWNHFLIKVIQNMGDWKLAVEFECDKQDFMDKLKSGVSKTN